MTDQPIIIDGVDVSKCRWFDYQKYVGIEDDGFSPSCYSESCRSGFCFNNPDCDFKQLARKIDECEKYKRAFDGILEIIRPIANKNPVYNCWTLLSKCDNCSEKEECGKQSPFTAAKQVLDIIDKIKEDKND